MYIQTIQEEIKKTNPLWKSPLELFKEAVAERTTSETIILDIGCGRSGELCHYYLIASKVIGLDPDEEALKAHPCLTERILGGLEKLKEIPDSSIGLIVTCWVLEHLENPELLFAEIKRILKPKGNFISLTPNKKSLISRISKLVPNKLHPKIVHKFWGRLPEDTYPTFYKANSIDQIRHLAQNNKLKVNEIRKVKDASYYILSRKFTKILLKLHTRIIPQNFAECLLIKISND